MAGVSLQPPCTDAKMLLGQDAEGFPSQKEFGAMITTVGVYQNVHYLLKALPSSFLPLPRPWGSACGVHSSGGTKALLSLQQSIFIICSNKSLEQGGNKH